MPLELFVYGTLRSGQWAFDRLAGKVKNPRRATVKGVLVYHDREGKDFPFLISSPAHLSRLEELTGITPHDVQGELYTITDLSLLEELDAFENINLPIDQGGLIPNQETPLKNILKRGSIDTIVDGEKSVEAQAYYANPLKTHTDRLVRVLSTKVIIPGGDWPAYVISRDEDSLTRSKPYHPSLGMETEFTPVVMKREGAVPLTMVRNTGNRPRDKYRFVNGDGKVKRFRSLTPMLSQLLFHFLTQNGLGLDVVPQYSENRPERNTRFLIPGGIAYVDGELPAHDGCATPILRKPSYVDRSPDSLQKQKEGKIVTWSSFNPAEVFFEVSGFPHAVTPGFSSRVAGLELMRRYQLEESLAHLYFLPLETKRPASQRAEKKRVYLTGHSSHYSYILNPHVGGVDLSDRTKNVPLSNRPSEYVSKYSYDVAYTLARTFGPLISYLLSGKTKGHVDFKFRPDNRLEYRNTYIDSPRQLEAGISVLATAIAIVESTIKDFVVGEARFQHATPTPSQDRILEVYKQLNPDVFVGCFSYSVNCCGLKPAAFTTSCTA